MPLSTKAHKKEAREQPAQHFRSVMTLSVCVGCSLVSSDGAVMVIVGSGFAASTGFSLMKNSKEGHT